MWPLAALKIGLLGGAALGGLSACATNPVTGTPDLVLMSEDQEIQLGREAAHEVLKAYRSYEDPRLQRYVSRIGRELSAHSHRSHVVFHFTVLDSPEVNAFALPGGYIYITRGILAYLNSEAELAGVLGHEIGHVTARHSVRQHTAQTATQLLNVIVGSKAGAPFGDLSQVLGTALVRGYGREHELEADRLGAEYMARLGYDPDEMLNVVRVLKAQEQFEIQRARQEGRTPRIYHGLFATHPDNDRRLQEVIGAARRLKPATPKPANRRAYLEHLEGLGFGPGEQDGVLRGRHFYHLGLDFALAFPEGWRVENRADRLLATAPGNDALIQLNVEDRNRRQSPQRLLEDLLGQDLSEGRAIRPNGLEGYTALAPPGDPLWAQDRAAGGDLSWGSGVPVHRSGPRRAARKPCGRAGLRDHRQPAPAHTPRDAPGEGPPHPYPHRPRG
jgi:predicted Zn-dependent protease